MDKVPFPGKGAHFFDYEIKKIEQENRYLREETRLVKKVSDLLEAKQEVRFQFLKEHKNELNIRSAFQTMNISKADFYEFLKRKPFNRKKRMNS